MKNTSKFRKSRSPKALAHPEKVEAPATPNNMPVCRPDAAGIDISATGGMYVCVPADRAAESVRCFGNFTPQLVELVAWLKETHIRTVAMESTGVYWVPLCQLLDDAGIEVFLVNARHVKNVTGRKTDVLDCQWLQFLHSVGLLRSSFRPPQAICALRSIARHRSNLLREGARHIHHLQKALDQMNLHLHHVIDDLTGCTGLAILEAILGGQRDPEALAQLRDRRIKATAKTLMEALTGDYRPEHVFVLRLALDSWKRVQGQVTQCEGELETMAGALHSVIDEERLTVLRAAQEPGKRRTTSKNAPAGQDWRRQLHGLFGVDLTLVPSISVSTVLVLLTEMGSDWSRFPTAGHLASWLALCPDNQISGGKVLRRGTRRATSRVRVALRMAAQSLHSNLSVLGDRYRRMRARLGGAEAITVMAHSLARILWHLVTKQESYDDSVYEKAEQVHATRRLKRIKKQAKTMGYELVPLAA
jgi:transposase